MTRFQFNHEYLNHNRRNDNHHQNNNQKRFRIYHNKHLNDDSSNQSSDRLNDRLTIDYSEVEKADEERIQEINDDDNVETHFFSKINTVKSIITKVFCNRCNEKFNLNNKLHQHIRSKTCRKPRRPLIFTTIFLTFSNRASSTVINSAFNTIDESIAPSFAEFFVDIEANFKSFNFINTNIHHVLSIKSFFKKFQFVVLFIFSFFQFKKYEFRE